MLRSLTATQPTTAGRIMCKSHGILLWFLYFFLSIVGSGSIPWTGNAGSWPDICPLWWRNKWTGIHEAVVQRDCLMLLVSPDKSTLTVMWAVALKVLNSLTSLLKGSCPKVYSFKAISISRNEAKHEIINWLILLIMLFCSEREGQKINE